MVREDTEEEELEEAQAKTAHTKEHSVPTSPVAASRPESTEKPILLSRTTEANGSAEYAKREPPSPRNTTFSTASGLLPVKHQPPERSKSPTKSAMKHSSSRGSSPANARPSSVTGLGPGDVSDTVSVGSDDVPRSQQRRRSMRVSFDDDAIVVGEAADLPSTANSPVVASPQNQKPVKRSWFSRGKSDEIDDQDDVIRPVPALPSFGSIRGRKENKNETVATSDTKAVESQDLGLSSDHAIGGLLGQNGSAGHVKPSQAEPLPPEVTSVDGTGYHSESEDEHVPIPTELASGLHDATGPSSQALQPPRELEAKTEADNSATSEHSQTTGPSVPMIAVLPATPGADSELEEEKHELKMPGEFPDSEPFPWQAVDPTHAPDSHTLESTVKEPPYIDSAAENGPAAAVGQIAQTELLLQKNQNDESDDSGESIYSDAAEDASDLEGDGFGSIDAIVDSPVVKPVKDIVAIEQEPVSPGPLTNVKKVQEVEDSSEDDIANAEPPPDRGVATNRSLSAPTTGLEKPKRSNQPPDGQGRQTRLAEKQGSTGAFEPSSQTVEKNGKQRGLRRSLRSSQNPMATLPVDEPSRGSPLQSQRMSAEWNVFRSPPPRSILRPSPKQHTRTASAESGLTGTRSDGPARSGMRRSMRGTGSDTAAMPQSPKARGHAPVNSLSSVPEKAPSRPVRDTTPKRLMPAGLPTMPRRGSNDSDSSSSFRKARRAKRSAGAGFAMRKSMRSSDAAPSPPPSRDAPKQDRPLGGITQRPESSGSTMRTTLRGAPPGKPHDGSPLGFGARMRASKAQASLPRSARPASSRINDSSDDGEVPQRYKSRYADSDDSDQGEPPSLKLAPVRGIPRTGKEGDSTDLDDSEEDRATPRRTKAVAARAPPVKNDPVPAQDTLNGLDVGRLKPADIAALADSGQPVEGKRKSWFSIRGRKKDASRIGKNSNESAARLDTHLEWSEAERAQLAQPQEDTPSHGEPPSTTTTPLPSPKIGKLQRRNRPQRMASDSWPFPESPSSPSSNARPTTSDGLAAARPGLAGRQASDVPPVPTIPALPEQTGKKKRFPMLRKALGMPK